MLLTEEDADNRCFESSDEYRGIQGRLCMNESLSIVGAAFGHYRSEHTHSGVPKYLFDALDKYADIVSYVNTKQLRPWDIFSGICDFSNIGKHRKPRINANWLWSHKTLARLNDRVGKCLSKIEAFDAFLQVGTHVQVKINNVKNYCVLDMTVSQAVKAKEFGLARLKKSQVPEAIEVQKKVFDSCNKIFTASQWVKQSILHDYGIDAQKVFVVAFGTSISDNIDITYKKPNLNILFLGRAWHRKGGPILLEAFKRVNQHLPDTKLTIIGCSPAISHRNVEVVGYLDKTDASQMHTLHESLRNATVLCVPSVFEPFGICFLEAQYYGVVPVTFTGEGRNEPIIDNITGVLVQERSPEALSEALLELLMNPKNIKKMSNAGYMICRKKFTWNCVAKRIIKLIQEDY